MRGVIGVREEKAEGGRGGVRGGDWERVCI